MPKIKVQTTQNVVFEYEVASVGDRIVAWLLDSVIRFLFLYIATAIFGVALFSSNDIEGHVVVFTILAMPVIFYYPILEYFWNGYTVGKRVMQIKVITMDGAKPGASAVILRWMMRIIDFHGVIIIAGLLSLEWLAGLGVMASPFAAILMVGIGKKGQRLGDIVAGSAVIKNKKIASLHDTILRITKDDYEPVYTNVLKLSDRDIRIIKEALEYYYKSNNAEHIRALAKKAKAILEVQVRVRPTEFLETIIKDYNALAMRYEEQSA